MAEELEDGGWPNAPQPVIEVELSPADKAMLDDCFSYHAPTSGQGEQIFEVNGAARDFMKAVLLNVPGCADRSAALRLIREAKMRANSAIVLEGRR